MVGRGSAEDAIERRLALLVCGTRDQRQARKGEAAELLAGADTTRMLRLLRRLKVTVMVGERLLSLDGDVDHRLMDEILTRAAEASERGRVQELVMTSILDRLVAAGIRAMPLKGAILARDLYGDSGRRTSGDLDILVAPEDLAGAIDAVEGMGWRLQKPVARTSRLPVLHERLTHDALPIVELHWRVHWYEGQFATDALRRAQPTGPHGTLRMEPADGLAALILFYARDGFAGLRLAADVAAWWDSRCEATRVDDLVGGIVNAYAALAAPILVGTRLLRSFVGLPAVDRHEPIRWRMAAELAAPFSDMPLAQLRANASLIDMLLAPPNGLAASLRRERQKIPLHLERGLTRHDDLSLHMARGGHLLRMTRRWTTAGGPAALRVLFGVIPGGRGVHQLPPILELEQPGVLEACRRLHGLPGVLDPGMGGERVARVRADDDAAGDTPSREQPGEHKGLNQAT